LNQAATRLENDDTLRGLATNWLVGPVGKALDGPEFTQTTYTPGYRLLQPYAPVHLRVARQNSGEDPLAISWIRRDRINADDWAAVDVPMSEASEAYQVTITSNLPGQLIAQVAQPHHSVSDAALIAEFGALPDALTIAVAQISATIGPGPATETTISL
ncbi:MAG: hypothetical protein HRU27_06815, partial [Rhizobiaceae bacterium]|nr:hypothetical protein [Rhizobiaceae bacterium]